jgi:hypothetical protein
MIGWLGRFTLFLVVGPAFVGLVVAATMLFATMVLLLGAALVL